MSNIGRPREGMKPCPHCGSKDRDSNGQCRCRNTLYRLTKPLTKTDAARAKEIFTEVLNRKGGTAEKAQAEVRVAFPTPVRAAKAAKKAVAKKTIAKKAAKPPTRVQREAEDAAVKAAKKVADDATEKRDPERYLLVLDDFEEVKYARKDAAIKNGVRSGQAWKVVYKGKVVAQSDDLI
jgi:hypothetical protein